MKKKKLSAGMYFIFLFGIVSLFSDMTHEGAASIRGSYFALLGASPSVIGFISGFGELIGYSCRYIFGKIADHTKHYWTFVLIGYFIDILVIPLFAFVGEDGWILACILFALQKIGKAIKKPSKDTILSFVATSEGAGKSFAIQEVLDQIGACLGPLFLYFIMLFQTEGSTFEIYSRCFLFLGIPALLTIFILLYTKSKYPHPEEFEPHSGDEKFKMKKEFVYYIVGISLFAFGFLDYSLILMHISRGFPATLITPEQVPLLYSAAMFIDALSALYFGYLYDRKGMNALIFATILSAPFAYFVFFGESLGAIIFGILLWGIGMGAQESILKAAVSKMVSKSNRATGYGLFEFFLGVSLFLGSWVAGILYEKNILFVVLISVITQLGSIPFYLLCEKQMKQVANA